MASYGFDFRATITGILPLVDAAGDTYVLASDTSSTTRNGITFQWDPGTPPDSRDRLTTGDARLAGINFRGNAAGEGFFKVTLPATGDWDIRAAFGDGTSSQVQYVRFKEGTTTFATISNVTSGVNEFVDAGGTLRTSQATWISSNASISRTFSSTDFRVYIGDPGATGGNNTTIAYLNVSQAGGSSAFIPIIGRGPGLALAGQSGLVGRQRQRPNAGHAWMRTPGGILINKHSGGVNHVVSR